MVLTFTQIQINISKIRNQSRVSPKVIILKNGQDREGRHQEINYHVAWKQTWFYTVKTDILILSKDLNSLQISTSTLINMHVYFIVDYS